MPQPVDIDRDAFAAEVERQYGVSIPPQFFYHGGSGAVYAGSEFVAQLESSAIRWGGTCGPGRVTEWAKSIAHMPLGHGIEVAERRPACDVPGHDPECECGYRRPDRNEQAFRALYVGDLSFDFEGLSPDLLDARCPGCGERVPCNEDGVLEHLKGRPRCEREVATA